MQVLEVMNTNVITAQSDTTVEKAAELMNKHSIGCLVIVTLAGGIEGILTERDILRKVVEPNLTPRNVRVKDVMTTKVYVITDSTPLEEAAGIMTKYKIKKLPVLNDQKKLVGIITASDIVAKESHLMGKLSGLMTSSPQKGVAG